MKNTSLSTSQMNSVETMAPISDLLAELRAGLANYWKTAETILRDCGLNLIPPSKSVFSYENNFVSLLFLYSFYRAKIPSERRIFYASIIQCLRGIVTGCDNLLDDEYKMTLNTDIPESGYRFRSVIDIMISDRVLFHILVETFEKLKIPLNQIQHICNASMKSITKSGVQEASEEGGITTILTPGVLLDTVHHFKTGLLFTCPWDIPGIIENVDPVLTETLKKGLYTIGIGCQILDDMMDFQSDIEKKRHNYLVSLIFYGTAEHEKKQVKNLLAAEDIAERKIDIYATFPKAAELTGAMGYEYLREGLQLLFKQEHRFLVQPAIDFLQKRIGVDLKQMQSRKHSPPILQKSGPDTEN